MMNAIKMLRERNGLSQRALAEGIGVTQQAVAKWETGGAYPRGEVLVKLADLLHCTIDELFDRSEPGGAEQDSA